MIASSSESGKRTTISSTTEWPVQSEVPRSNRAISPIQSVNCSHMGLSRPSKWRSSSMTDWGTGEPAYLRATMSPGTARMMTNVKMATPTSVGIMSRSRPATYRRIR